MFVFGVYNVSKTVMSVLVRFSHGHLGSSPLAALRIAHAEDGRLWHDVVGIGSALPGEKSAHPCVTRRWISGCYVLWLPSLHHGESGLRKVYPTSGHSTAPLPMI